VASLALFVSCGESIVNRYRRNRGSTVKSMVVDSADSQHTDSVDFVGMHKALLNGPPC
jgi:hypothetical protein